MNISTSSSNLGYYSSANNELTTKSTQNDSLFTHDRDAKTAAVSPNEQSPQEQQLEEAKHYKKEDQQKELKKKESDQFFEEQQKHKEEINKIAYEMLANQGIVQIGVDNQLALNKDNYGDTVKNLVAKGFQIDTDEQKLTISSKLHQLKLEISKESYNQYVKTVYGKEIADEYTDIEESSIPGPVHSSHAIAGNTTISSTSSTAPVPSATPQSEPVSPTNSSQPTPSSSQTEPSASQPTPATTTGISNHSNTGNASDSTTSTSGSPGSDTSSGKTSSNNNGNAIGNILSGGLVK